VPHLFYALRIGKILQIHRSSSNEFEFFVLPRFFSPVLLLKNGMERPANHRNPSQSWRFCEEKGTAGARNGRRYSAWTWPSPKWIGHFNKLKIRNRFVLSAPETFQECQAPPSYRCLSVPTVDGRRIFKMSLLLGFEKGF
jgi:hypothetical protein